MLAVTNQYKSKSLQTIDINFSTVQAATIEKVIIYYADQMKRAF